jgi:glutamate-1-semialdehyde 2,1-aminomutase
MSVIRLVRGITGKNKIIKFAGCYHGHADSFLIEAGSGALTFGKPNSPGVTSGTVKDTLIAEFNSIESVENLLKKYGSEIAGVILEPVNGNTGCIAPKDGFLRQLRSLCDAHGCLLVFDEVITGFRIAKGGASEYFSVIPDLYAFGKVIGGGMPIGAYGGKKDLMEEIAPMGPIYQAGTVSGNPVAVSA